ncbi:MAG: hypothetical protein CBB71_18725, partial [Rhodopirellula sp. TMED11]
PQGQNPQGQNPQGQNPQGQNPQGQNPQGQNPQGQNPQGQPQQGQGRPGPGLRQEQPSSEQQTTEQQTTERGGRAAPSSPERQPGPFTGDFREWSESMRDIEEMVGDPEFRNRANAIRDRVREMRAEMKKHASGPKWNLIEDLVAEPMRELNRDVRSELLRRTAEKNELVPIDRDPVPEQFSDAVKQYYENLGRVRPTGSTSVGGKP